MGAPIWSQKLQRPFRVIIFDWDGAAVGTRVEDASGLADSLGRLLERGVKAVVVTGTHFHHLERQLLAVLGQRGRENLILCTNRGSEVFGFPSGGPPVRWYYRQSNEGEERALDRAAMALQKAIFKEFHVVADLIFDRLNRRKIDLIPTPEWAAPPKSRVCELLAAVESRLGSYGAIPPIQWLVKRARELAKESGLEDARVTTDLKHIEIGLTDKSDAARWVYANVILPAEIPVDDVCILGDEFGSAGGVPGSDSMLHIPELKDSAVVSVGVEPSGVPLGVEHVVGGPATFQDFLDLQLAFLEWGISRDPSWCVEQGIFDPAREREMEALFSIANGQLGVRGAFEISIPSSESDLYVAGVYDSKSPIRPYSELEFITPQRTGSPDAEMAPIPSPFRLQVSLNGEVLEVTEDAESSHRRRLDLGTGVLQVEQEFLRKGVVLQVSARRLASLVDSKKLLHEVELRICGADGRIDFEIGCDFSEFQLRHPHLTIHESQEGSPWSNRGTKNLSELILFETRSSRRLLALATRMQVNDQEVEGRSWSGQVRDGQVIRVRRVIVLCTDGGSAEATLERAVLQARELDFSDFHRWISRHRQVWRSFWDRADIPFSSNSGLTESQRFNTYHLRSAAPVHGAASIPARMLSGRGYEGHVFWESEIFMLPFFALQAPEFARRLLEYRHRTLDGARRRAIQLGYRGACYAWESTVSGDDVTPDKIVLKSSGAEIPIYTGTQQIHVTADIAHAVWKYWFCTGDSDFMKQSGAEILFETARFWASRCTLENGTFHINRVVGPDEYHHDVRDNAYTNWMARFNLLKALWVRDWLAESDPRRLKELSIQLQLTAGEFGQWDDVASRVFIQRPREDGVIEQFDGFFRLQEIRVNGPDRLKAPVRRLLDWKAVNASRICKQADVLMLPFLFPENFSDDVVRANYQYYEPITDHGSSLSPPVHSLIAARIGEREDAISYYRQSVELDLFNLMQNTSLGVHAGCMGGSWQALVFGMMGIQLSDSGPAILSGRREVIPRDWGSLRCRLLFRGKLHELEVSAA